VGFTFRPTGGLIEQNSVNVASGKAEQTRAIGGLLAERTQRRQFGKTNPNQTGCHLADVGKPGCPMLFTRARVQFKLGAIDAALVTVNDLVKTVHENESIYIPIGAVRRLENPGKLRH
jgi:hypothetical protein